MHADPTADDPADIDRTVLAKVRALLAKAESTTFEAEADALVAKAHQLMARHAIDRALVDAGTHANLVTSRRVPIDHPYLRAKYLLLAEVARASSCRALLHSGQGYATVFGHACDLDATDLLYTSLLRQATAGVVVARPADAHRMAASQIAAYRRAWLVAFGQRIGDRLRTASQAAVHEAVGQHGDSLLPVLASREHAVEAAMRDAAPRVRSLRTSVSSAEGWRAGAAAGERATLANQAGIIRG